jgi:glucuronoarabinoxylan endo-1,4-beta-xylanase
MAKGIRMHGAPRDARLRRVAGLAFSALALTSCAGQVGSDDPSAGGAAGASTGLGGATASGGGKGAGGNGLGGAGRGGASGGMTGSGGRGGTNGGAAGSGGAGAGGAGGAQICAGGAAQAGDVTVNLADLHQKISGFGASTAWGSTMSAADAAQLWSTTTGAGLSLHRIRIDYTNGHTSELNIAKMAVSYGVNVWATPWTPPGADKTGCRGTNCSVEGTLSNPTAYATFLLGFLNYMKGQGVPIYAISAQNEPDANVTYESCVYTPATMASWVGGTMGPMLASSGVKIMSPETQNWCGFPGFEAALLADANAKMYTSIIATHEYGCSPKAYPEIAQAGKELWETEIYDTASTTADTGMPSALRIAKLIHDAMTIASMNAWHYWWVYPASANNGALWDFNTKQATKRLWVEGNFARFVRPGFVRVGTAGTAPAGVLLSAYTNPADGTVAVVAINNNTGATPLSLFVSGAAPCSLTPWVTAATDTLAAKTAVSVSGSRVSVTLGAQSVTTLVGKP